MVGERFLEQQVHRAQVFGHRHPVGVGVHRAHPHPGAHRDRVAVRLRGLHRTAHVPPGAGQLKTGITQPALLTFVGRVRQGVESRCGQAALGGHLPGDLGDPAQHGRRDGVVVGRLRVEHEVDVGASRGPVVHAGPAGHLPLRVAQHELAAGPRAAPDELGLQGLGVDPRRAAGHLPVALQQAHDARHVVARG